jgi:hypothetical protein
MVTHKFAIGDRVRLRLDKGADNRPEDVHTISRKLPADAMLGRYRVKREVDGQERAVSELQLVKLTPDEPTQIEAQQELQGVRNTNAEERARSATFRSHRQNRRSIV